jgi:hypothetical protein
LLSLQVILSAEPKPQVTPKSERAFLVDVPMLEGDLAKKLAAARATALVIELNEKWTAADYEKAFLFAEERKLPLFGWIEVARNPDMARKHPEWMASLGHHDDWRKRFPDFPKAGDDEVIKVWPWVTIWYEEAFQAHLARVKSLLAAAPAGLAGVYLSDIQGGPSSCGCGNDQCRWAQDYHIPSTATKLMAPETPARFVTEVRKLIPGKPVLPVWCIECEEIDQYYSRPGTGYCGGVGCFKGLCWKEYFKQLAPLLKETENALAVAAFSHEFRREGSVYDGKPGWISAAIDTFQALPPPHDLPAIPAGSLQLVLQGWDDKPQRLAGELAQAEEAGCRQTIVSLIKIDQSWRPMAQVVGK